MQISIIYILVFLCWLPSIGSTKVSPCARWNTAGTIVAGAGGRGSKPDQLQGPEAIFIHQKTNILYVADTDNNRIQMFSLNELTAIGTTVISNVSYVMKIYVDDDNNEPTIYLALEGENCVKKWVQGASKGVQVGGECPYCTGVWVDKEKNVYMSSASEHCVYKWWSQTNSTTVAAGRKYYSGSTSDNLYSPEGVHVNGNSDALYVADYGNNRIQEWLPGASNGTTVAGLSSGYEGSDAESLSRPTAIWVDDDTNVIYVADSSNERIQRWLYNASMGETIAGGSGTGSKPNQFDQPVDIAFDTNGNLYVCDRLNDRVLMFMIIHNEPCFPTSTATGSFSSLSLIVCIATIFALLFRMYH